MNDRTPAPYGSRPPAAKNLSREKYQRLVAEAKSPYRGFRMFVYAAFGASGFVGALVFVARLAAGRDIASDLPNLALQVGVVALMVWLFRLDRRAGRKKAERDAARSQAKAATDSSKTE